MAELVGAVTTLENNSKIPKDNQKITRRLPTEYQKTTKRQLKAMKSRPSDNQLRTKRLSKRV